MNLNMNNKIKNKSFENLKIRILLLLVIWIYALNSIKMNVNGSVTDSQKIDFIYSPFFLKKYDINDV